MSITDIDLEQVSALRPVVEMHPHWCEWSSGCQDDPSDMEHRGLESAWPLRGDVDDASVHLALTRHDEISKSAPTVQHCGEPVIQLTIRQTAALNLDGSPIVAAAHLCLEDAELLLAFLGRHVERLLRARPDLAQLESDDDRKSA